MMYGNPSTEMQQADLARLEAELAATEARAALAEAAVAKADAMAALARAQAAYRQTAATPDSSVAIAPPPAGSEHGVCAQDDTTQKDALQNASNSPAAPPPVATLAPPAAMWAAAVHAIPALPPASSDPPQAIVQMEDPSSSVHWLYDNRVVQNTFSVLFSMVVHLVLLIALGLWLLPALMRETHHELLASQELTPQEMVNQTLDAKLTATNELTFATSSMVTALSGGDGIAGVSEPAYKQVATPSSDAPPVKINDIERVSGRGKALNLDVPEGAKGDPLVVVDNYQQAMDRITQEILLRLAKGKVLVVWCFDQSESMKDDRQEIRQRIERVYTELGLAGATAGDALHTSIISYGQAMTTHTRHGTANIDAIRLAMDQVPTDPSGLEMQCQAVGHAIAQHRGYVTAGHRQMMLILVTDESGNPSENFNVLEATIAEAKAAGCAIYVLGREAVFGYPYAHMSTVVTVPAVGGGTISRHFVVPIDRGPETPFVEQLQTEGFHARQDAHPSGFGPYEQVRMARETGGMFFMLPSPEIDLFLRDDRKYALDRIRPYMPDLSSRVDYVNERDKHPDRATLWKVINDLNPYDPERARYITPRMTFSADPATFVTQVRIEQERAKQYVIYLDAAEKALEGMKKQRQREPLPRWQANYDLIFAQLLAYKVRIFEYGAYLENFINHPKRIDPLTPTHQLHHWAIALRHETITGYLTSSYIERSRAGFEGVIREHEGTPWSGRAELELQRGFGVELNPVYYDPTPPPPSIEVPSVPQQPIVAPNL
jgi:hypothetical protein